jgi:hypothetical protein
LHCKSALSEREDSGMDFETERDYEFTYKKIRTAKEEQDGKLTIILKQYIESYNDELPHLMDYPKSMVLDQIYPNKEEFVKEAIQEQFGDVFVSVDELRNLVKLIDGDIDELNGELKDDNEFDNDDDF